MYCRGVIILFCLISYNTTLDRWSRLWSKGQGPLELVLGRPEASNSYNIDFTDKHPRDQIILLYTRLYILSSTGSLKNLY